MIGLNIGSGQRRFTTKDGLEWINIDKITRPDQIPDLVCDGAHIPFDDNSVEYFVLHHVMEHFGCGEAGHLVQEAYRVLKPRGSLLVFVPDMLALATRWIGGSISTQIYMTNVYGAYQGWEEDRHKWGYDYCSLHQSIRAYADWKTVCAFDFRAIPGADIAQDWWILGMEATK